MKAQVTILLATAMLMALAGCSSNPSDIESQINAQNRHAEALKTQQTSTNSPHKGVQFSDGFYIGNGRSVPLNQRASLPSWFNENILLAAKGLYLVQVAEQISQKANIPVTIDPLLMQEQSTGQVQMMGNQEARTGAEMSISYDGPLSGLLDQVAAHYGIQWRYSDGEVVLYKYVTRTYTLAVLPGLITQNVTVSNASSIGTQTGGETGGTTASSNQTVIASQNNDSWKSLVQEISNILSTHGKLEASEVAGTITVTDTPAVQEEVNTSIQQYNQSMRRQCEFTVRIISLDTSAEHQREFSLAAVYNNLKKEYSAAFTGLTPPVGTTGDASLSASVLSPTNNFNSALGQGHWSGSSALMQVLDQYGQVSLVTEGTGIAMQGQPLPMQVTNTQGYLASSASIIGTAATAGSVSLTPGQVTTGFALLITPRIMPNGDIIFQYALDLSNLNAIQTITSGTQEIQVPNVSSRKFVQRAVMHTGDTLILSGFEQTDNESNKAHGLSSWFHGTSSDRKMIFITIQANVI